MSHYTHLSIEEREKSRVMLKKNILKENLIVVENLS